MKVLVDTSVWSLALRRQNSSRDGLALRFAELIESGVEIFLLGIIFQELLQGIKGQRQFSAIQAYLKPFPFLALQREDYTFAAYVYNRCCDHGISQNTIDCLIAAAAINHDCTLFTTDKDFERIATVLPLKLLSKT